MKEKNTKQTNTNCTESILEGIKRTPLTTQNELPKK